MVRSGMIALCALCLLTGCSHPQVEGTWTGTMALGMHTFPARMIFSDGSFEIESTLDTSGSLSMTLSGKTEWKGNQFTLHVKQVRFEDARKKPNPQDLESILKARLASKKEYTWTGTANASDDWISFTGSDESFKEIKFTVYKDNKE